ncbi:transmembrane protein, putative (macronuclear) [Tetrahymena thermophila SB210]|uniref:Transmembrane protein, putative n=1 Tax=Tetrahymena thermophila (strain SB210) TaxID=312017 RepID=I7M0B0_TETTS|nr:transmembrane protein, putative [Tetrahymena thermophila SB210]EAR86097.2 transmembrane protein, putative [Tetrahymena thermophila SB210]|eukprot:XP_976692.2 transmembrane protein, putative [Tetrahymena thermophila SB210]
MRNQKQLACQMENQILLIDEENQLSHSNNIQTSVEDFYFLIQNLTYEEFLSQNFERIKLYSEKDDNKYQTAFWHLDVILNQKICMYQQKEEQPIQKILQTKGNTIKMLPNQVNLTIRYTPLLDWNLNSPQIKLELTQKQENIQEPHQMKGLSKQQLKQIKDFGYFYVQLNNSIERWKISESFYTPKNSLQYSNQLQVLKQSLTKSLKILYNEQNILGYKNLRKKEFEDFSLKNISLLQGVIGVINIPYQLFGILFGVPMYKKDSQIIKEKMTMEDFVESLKKQLNITSSKKVADYLELIQCLNISPIAYLYESIQKFEGGEITLFIVSQACKLYLVRLLNMAIKQFTKNFKRQNTIFSKDGVVMKKMLMIVMMMIMMMEYLVLAVADLTDHDYYNPIHIYCLRMLYYVATNNHRCLYSYKCIHI